MRRELGEMTRAMPPEYKPCGTFIAFLADLPVALAAKEFRKVLLQSDADDQWPTTVKYRSMIHDILRNRD